MLEQRWPTYFRETEMRQILQGFMDNMDAAKWLFDHQQGKYDNEGSVTDYADALLIVRAETREPAYVIGFDWAVGTIVLEAYNAETKKYRKDSSGKTIAVMLNRIQELENGDIE